MQIQTKFLGEVEIQEEEIITLTSGLLGLEDYTKYVLLPLEKDSPLAFFQSVEEPQVGFVVAYPFAFKKIMLSISVKPIKKTCRLKKKKN